MPTAPLRRSGASTASRRDLARGVRAWVECLARIAARHDLALAAAARRFPLVASGLFGTPKAASVRRNLEFLNLSIPSAMWPEFEPNTLTGLPT